VAVNCVVPAGRGSGLCESGSWIFLEQGIVRACVRVCVCVFFLFVCVFTRSWLLLYM
jgi:hypothetical protein